MEGVRGSNPLSSKRPPPKEAYSNPLDASWVTASQWQRVFVVDALLQVRAVWLMSLASG